jgi:hypothetical protein
MRVDGAKATVNGAGDGKEVERDRLVLRNVSYHVGGQHVAEGLDNVSERRLLGIARDTVPSRGRTKSALCCVSSALWFSSAPNWNNGKHQTSIQQTLSPITSYGCWDDAYQLPPCGGHLHKYLCRRLRSRPSCAA